MISKQRASRTLALEKKKELHPRSVQPQADAPLKMVGRSYEPRLGRPKSPCFLYSGRSSAMKPVSGWRKREKYPLSLTLITTLGRRRDDDDKFDSRLELSRFRQRFWVCYLLVADGERPTRSIQHGTFDDGEMVYFANLIGLFSHSLNTTMPRYRHTSTWV